MIDDLLTDTHRMNAKRILILLTLMLFVMISARGQQTAYPFSKAKTLPEKSYDPTQFEFSNVNDNYTILSSGRGHRKRNGEARSFNLRLPRYNRLMRDVYYTVYERDLLLIVELGDECCGYGFIVRLDGQTLKIKWKRSIHGFNVGQGLMDGKYAYVTGIGFVGKVDLKSGRYAWKHPDLYQRESSAFNSFELPEVQGELVVFKELPHYSRKKQAVVKVDRTTGKIRLFDH